MADPRYKKYRSKVKDLKQGIRGDYHRPPAKKKKAKPKPFKVKRAGFRLWGSKPWTAHEAATREAAQEWIDKQMRSYESGRDNPYWIEEE